jgi:hypothetical protein
MAALFALGAMSLTWMALATSLAALQEVCPSRRAATAVTVAVLLALVIGLLAAPGNVPGLVVPHGSLGVMHPTIAIGH